MSNTPKRAYTIVQPFAAQLAERLAPSCQRIEIAGSVRRGSTWVGDLEIVCIDNGKRLSQRLGVWLNEGIIKHVQAGPKRLPRWGDKMKSFVIGLDEFDSAELVRPDIIDLNGDVDDLKIQVDVFITTPAEWGYTYLVRTGSKEFSNRMVTPIGSRTHDQLPGLMPKGLFCRDCRVHLGNQVYDTPEEDDIFSVWGMEFVAPAQRTADYIPVPRRSASIIEPHSVDAVKQASLF